MALPSTSLPRCALVLCLTALGAFGSRLLAENVEVVFTSGERAYGELLSQSAGEVDITRIVYTRSRIITSQASYPGATVAAVIPVPSLLDYYQTRAKTTPDTYADQYALARWCFERGLQDQAFIHAKHLYDQDPTDESSQALLKEIGYVLDDGQWIKEGAYAAKHGLVTFDGHLMTPGQVELRRTDLKDQLLLNNGIEHSLTLANAIVNDQRRIKQEQERMTALEKEIADDKAQNQAANQAAGQGNRTNRQNQAQQQAADPTTDDSDEVAQKKDIQSAIDSATKQLAIDQTAQADFVPVLAKLQSDDASAHQAFVATLPQAEQDQDAARLKALAKSAAPAPAPAASEARAAKHAPAKDDDSDK